MGLASLSLRRVVPLRRFHIVALTMKVGGATLWTGLGTSPSARARLWVPVLRAEGRVVGRSCGHCSLLQCPSDCLACLREAGILIPVLVVGLVLYLCWPVLCCFCGVFNFVWPGLWGGKCDTLPFSGGVSYLLPCPPCCVCCEVSACRFSCIAWVLFIALLELFLCGC